MRKRQNRQQTERAEVAHFVDVHDDDPVSKSCEYDDIVLGFERQHRRDVFCREYSVANFCVAVGM